MEPKFIMIHHSAVSYQKNSDQFNANNNYHKSLWNFKSSLGYYLGYNYEIAKNGRVRQARADGESTAACYQMNMNDGRCIHICLDGNFDIEKPQSSQIYALRDLLKKLCKKYLIKKEDIFFHNDFAAKSCPGANLDKIFIQNLSVDEKPQTPDKIKQPAYTKDQIKHEILELLNKL